jgi:hypothetical protein
MNVTQGSIQGSRNMTGTKLVFLAHINEQNMGLLE